MSLKQITANGRNARKSTGPRTPAGKAVSKMNAVKHGILSKEVLVRGRCLQENNREFAALHQRFWEDWNPAGATEEMLVEQMVTTCWRWRRALKAESGEIALNVDEGQWRRSHPDPHVQWTLWDVWNDPVTAMQDSVMGNLLLARWLREVHARVEQDGELTEAAINILRVRDKPNSLTLELEKLRQQWQQNPEGLEAEATRAKHRQAVLAYLDRELGMLEWRKDDCEKREEVQEESRQAAAELPTMEVLDKILRYETKLERQFYRAMNQLERLQRLRRGEAVPPLTVELSERA